MFILSLKDSPCMGLVLSCEQASCHTCVLISQVEQCTEWPHGGRRADQSMSRNILFSWLCRISVAMCRLSLAMCRLSLVVVTGGATVLCSGFFCCRPQALHQASTVSALGFSTCGSQALQSTGLVIRALRLRCSDFEDQGSHLP